MKLSLLSTLASGIFALAVGSATGITTHMIGEQVSANVAEARTVEVLQATATRIAEQKIQTTLAVDVTIPVSREQMNAVSGYAIPLHEQAPAIETLGATLPYNTTVYPTFTPSPHVDSSRTPAPVSAGIYAAAVDTITPTAAAITPTASAWPSGTPSATPVVLVVETLAATAAEWDATPTPHPTVTEQPTITENPTPWPTVAPIHTSTPQPDDTNTPTIEPSATDEATITPPPLVTVTDGPLQSPLATPIPDETETPAP